MTMTIAAESSLALRDCPANQCGLLRLGENSPNQFNLFSGHMKRIDFPFCLPVSDTDCLSQHKEEPKSKKRRFPSGEA